MQTNLAQHELHPDATNKNVKVEHVSFHILLLDASVSPDCRI